MKAGGRSLRTITLVAAMAVVVLGAGAGAYAQQEHGGRFIVAFQPDVRAGVQRALIEGWGVTPIKVLPLINAWAVRADPMAVTMMRAQDRVLRVDTDLLIEAFAEGDKPEEVHPAPGYQPPQTVPWGIERVRAPEAWASSEGAGVKVGIVDTGIDLNHPDLRANIAGNASFVLGAPSGEDDNGHGTHVAGTVAAVNNEIGVVGVAPRAKLYAVKVLSRTGQGWLSDIIDGLTWCVNNRIQVVNMSLGCAEGNESFHAAIQAVHGAGIIMVAAAGNDGQGRVSYPAAYDEEVIAVSATDSDNRLASFSNYGWEIDFAAPGVGINSTYFRWRYRELSGTSMASPHVAGVCALRLAAHRRESPAEVEAALAGAAEDLGAAGPDPNFGNGLINALGAL